MSVSLWVMSNSAIPWTVALQAPLPMGFSRQEYWSGQSFPSPGDPLDPRIKPGSPEWQADSLPSEATRDALGFKYSILISDFQVPKDTPRIL